MISTVHPAFSAQAFIADALNGYEALDLVARGRHIAETLHRHLPNDYSRATEILLASLGPKLERTENFGMAPFLYLPHVIYVATYGIEHFEISMHAQYELTQRFSAEFSIRRFLERYPEATLARLRLWTTDSSPHVRRLVSEGTRPRLPWAPRLRAFQADPRPVLDLLERLKDDPVLYVRRSVANNLNDIGKDHPDLLVQTARRWLVDASTERRWLVQHALRSALRRAEKPALDVLGISGKKVSIREARISPKRARVGESVSITFQVANTDAKAQHVRIDCRIFFVKANGSTSPKVFTLKDTTLGPRESVTVRKKISLAQLTTRKHYPGTHRVDVVVNGHTRPLGSFELANPGKARR
ncbi:MAG: DNA alkylation repair protein [Longimicrobiales bacterium]